MANFVEKWVVSLMFAVSPLSSSADIFEIDLKNQTNSQLSETLNFQDDREVVGSYIDSKIIAKSVLDYFDEEVKAYKLKPKTREKVVSILNSYFTAHPILVIRNEWRMSFVIDDKREFSCMVKQLVNLIIDAMPFLIKRVGIPLYFGWNDRLQEKLDNLWNTVMNMKEKQYKDVVFDYLLWIVKRVAKSVDWKMTVIQYYRDVSGYFPNKNSDSISKELIKNWIWNKDIKYMEYPFEK